MVKKPNSHGKKTKYQQLPHGRVLRSRGQICQAVRVPRARQAPLSALPVEARPAPAGKPLVLCNAADTETAIGLLHNAIDEGNVLVELRPQLWACRIVALCERQTHRPQREYPEHLGTVLPSAPEPSLIWY